MATSFTVIDDGGLHQTEAVISGGSVRIPPEAIGFEVKPEGLCRGALCYPIADGSRLMADGALDLSVFAELSQRPIAFDLDHDVVFLGASAGDRGTALASLAAPDFTLPDLNGTPHSLSDYRGKKVLLVAYASW
jgi:hypothetical protein